MSTESPTTLPAETHTLSDCQREGHYHIDTIGHPAERLCHCPKLGRIICAISFSRRAASVGAAFQGRVDPWLLACFGEQIARDKEERNHRFLEEALELVQSCGCTQSEAHQLVDYTFNRPSGEASQEVGGVVVTLAALCLANGLDMHEAGETELVRIWTALREAERRIRAARPE